MTSNFKFQTSNSQKGFTILELLVAVSIFGGLAILVALLFSDVFSGSKQQLLAVDNVEQSRLVASQFLNEMRNATTGVSGEYSLGQAGDQQIIFYSKTTGTSTVNRIRYYVSGTKLYKGVVIPTGNPLTYNLGSEVVKVAQNDLTNGTGQVFTYYGDTYSGSENSLTQPINLTAVKFVKINLTVLTQAKNNSNTTYSISEGVTIRNLKTNLGN